ncbi:sirohydrochlorin chelatase [Actinacidiphila acididurans]|uniref:Sirohydrochlorin chelatase n=1 Tax=Actinacidiphila acididurans TaxID=2784346 RepID=A0ABS2TVL9_9ACTN|nr:CbiX/SirB N-terminal domain-containing protein [Actinacidiphila acididurans]MBM9507389.1 sirohydrochlorin chelatase [Actinacidiphila acididurans]
MTARARRPALLVIAHGSRDPRHARTVRALTRRVARARPALRVETAFLDFCAPSVPQAAARLAADGEAAAVALPLLLTRAFHAKTDVPAVLREAEAGTGLPLHAAGVLGPSPLLTVALERRLRQAGVGPGERAGTGVVLAAAGSTDPGARAVIEALAAQWRRSGWYGVEPAFASASPPRTQEAVRRLRAAGARRVAVAPYVLAPGFLPDRIAAGALEAGADVLAPVLGAAPEVAALLLRRYDEACAAMPLGSNGTRILPAGDLFVA